MSALQERQQFRHIDVHTRLMKLSKYWNRQHKRLYRFRNIFGAKRHDKSGRKWRLDKVYEAISISLSICCGWNIVRGKIIEFIKVPNQFGNI